MNKVLLIVVSLVLTNIGIAQDKMGVKILGKYVKPTNSFGIVYDGGVGSQLSLSKFEKRMNYEFGISYSKFSPLKDVFLFKDGEFKYSSKYSDYSLIQFYYAASFKFLKLDKFSLYSGAEIGIDQGKYDLEVESKTLFYYDRDIQYSYGYGSIQEQNKSVTKTRWAFNPKLCLNYELNEKFVFQSELKCNLGFAVSEIDGELTSDENPMARFRSSSWSAGIGLVYFL